MARTIAYEKRTPGATVYPGKHWEYAVLFDLDQESPDRKRLQFDERSSWFYEAIGMSVGMQGRVVGFGQVYLEASKDAKGQWLDGGRGPLITPQGAADLSSRKPDLVSNADGSVDVTFGPVRPAGAKNWIQTTPGKGWFAYFRFYGPSEPYFAKTWQLNDIEPIGP